VIYGELGSEKRVQKKVRQRLTLLYSCDLLWQFVGCVIATNAQVHFIRVEVGPVTSPHHTGRHIGHQTRQFSMTSCLGFVKLTHSVDVDHGKRTCICVDANNGQNQGKGNAGHKGSPWVKKRYCVAQRAIRFLSHIW
jgi:hypothetical protein